MKNERKKTELMLKLKRYRHTQLEAVQVDPTTSSTCFHGSLSSCFGKETFSNEEERRPWERGGRFMRYEFVCCQHR